MIIESGIGNGTQAGVDEDNRLLTAAFNIPFEHLIAKDYQKTFSVNGVTGTLASGENNILYVENDNENQVLVLNRILLQTAGATLGSTDAFLLEVDAEYDTGGTAVTPVNLSSGSSVTSGIRAFQGAYGLTGAPKEVTALYNPADKTMFDFDLNGGVLVLPGKAINIAYGTTSTAGIATCTAFFSVVGTEGYSG